MRSSLRVVQLAARAGAPSRAIAGVVPPLRPAHRYAMLRGMATSSRGSYRHAPPPNLGFVIVPQQKAYIIERLGRFYKTLEPGFHLLIPIVDRVAYVHSLKEEAISIPSQTAITKDNVVLQIDGVLYLRVKDPYDASYGVTDPIYALEQLAQTTMRSELGKLTLDRTFEERDSLNAAIVQSINKAAENWGTEVMRYEIKDIVPPAGVRSAMEMQAEAERRKRADILASEGKREAAINNAEGERQSVVLAAQGEAQAIFAKAEAQAKAVDKLADAMMRDGAQDAVSLRIAEQYVSAFSNLAKRGNTILLPANTGDVSSMVAQALAVYGNLQARRNADAAASSQEDWVESELEDIDESLADKGSAITDSVDTRKKGGSEPVFVPRPY